MRQDSYGSLLTGHMAVIAFHVSQKTGSLIWCHQSRSSLINIFSEMVHCYSSCHPIHGPWGHSQQNNYKPEKLLRPKNCEDPNRLRN